MTNILWLRRDLQLADNKSLALALEEAAPVQPIFIFDSKILERFTNKKDRRITFIANALAQIDSTLREKGGELLVFQGNPVDIIPKLSAALAGTVFAGEDYEPSAIARDREVSLKTRLVLSKQHVILSPKQALKDDGTPYKVFTPYSRQWRAVVTDIDTNEARINDKGRYAKREEILKTAKQAGLKVIDTSNPAEMVSQIGYEYVEEDLWKVEKADALLKGFAAKKLSSYKEQRDIPSIAGTSRLSPYLRFGLVTIRQCYNAVKDLPDNQTWVNELIWREFYAMILFHYPETVNKEFQPQYRDLEWKRDEDRLQQWKEGKTGYPIIDAGMRQLLGTGWMHNRVRMLVASFLVKDLGLDWRLGEEHFAQYLMDYEQASNVGGWQWAAGTGTDAAPYFRVFNPETQSRKFDASGEYIRKYVPELKTLSDKEIHAPLPLNLPKGYPRQMVDHDKARKEIIKFYKREA